MRPLLLTLAMLAVCLQTVEAQDEITIHVDGQPLAELITAEQQKSLQTLNITGELAEEDYAFLREGNLPQLRELNLRKANIHTIPKKAFYGWNLEYGFLKNGRIVLPESLDVIQLSISKVYSNTPGVEPAKPPIVIFPLTLQLVKQFLITPLA